MLILHFWLETQENQIHQQIYAFFFVVFHYYQKYHSSSFIFIKHYCSAISCSFSWNLDTNWDFLLFFFVISLTFFCENFQYTGNFTHFKSFHSIHLGWIFYYFSLLVLLLSVKFQEFRFIQIVPVLVDFYMR